MRKSRVLLAGVAVAAAAVTTSAFTTSNDFSTVDNNVAGYGELAVSGATVTNIAYNPATDVSKLQSVVFTTSNNITGASAVMGFTKLTAPVTAANSCVINGGLKTITCTLTTPLLFTDFDSIGLTVVSQ
jgi:hypothetical protein